MIDIYLKAIHRKETQDRIPPETLEAEVTDSTCNKALRQGLTLGVRFNLGVKTAGMSMFSAHELQSRAANYLVG